MFFLTLKRFWFNAAIRLAYLLRLRTLSVRVQRWLKERHAPRVPLFQARTSHEVPKYADDHNYQWRADTIRIGGWLLPLDWPSHPEVFQARLEQRSRLEGDGDCDDRHTWAAHCYARLLTVDKVVLCSVGFPGGGHTVCAFEEEGQWYLDNYGLQKINDPNQIPDIIAKWGTSAPKEPVVYWYVFEALNFKPLAISPAKLDT